MRLLACTGSARMAAGPLLPSHGQRRHDQALSRTSHAQPLQTDLIHFSCRCMSPLHRWLPRNFALHREAWAWPVCYSVDGLHGVFRLPIEPRQGLHALFLRGQSWSAQEPAVCPVLLPGRRHHVSFRAACAQLGHRRRCAAVLSAFSDACQPCRMAAPATDPHSYL